MRSLLRGRATLEPRADRPLPLWAVFPLLFIGVYLTHITLLRLPYYGDEAGYYIPAAYDFFRSGALIPKTTLANGHPPLPSIYLAMWWKASGFAPAVTRVAMCLITALALLAVYRLGRMLTGRPQAAAATTILTLLYPVWFAQSTLAHADMFAAAGTLWGLVFVFAALRKIVGQPCRGAPAVSAAACFSLAALSKETAIVTPVALALWEGWKALRRPPEGGTTGERGRRLRFSLSLLFPLLPLAAWYGYYRCQTGYLFGNPQYFKYNAGSTFTPLRIALALGHRILQVTAHMNMFVPVLCALAALLLLPVLERGLPRPRIGRADQAVLYVVIVANLIFFSLVGGALLTRYLLPLYPLVLVICVSTIRQRVPYWWALIGLSAAAFIIGLVVNPPYKFAPEDNLSYVDVVRLQQQAIRRIVTRDRGSTVLTAWPATDELTKPELGYVRTPVPVVKIDNFSLPEIEQAASSTKDFTVCFAFSTKYIPPRQWLSLGARNEALDKRFFGFHQDLEPQAIARLLSGRVVWRTQHNGEWAAILHLNRPQTAKAGGALHIGSQESNQISTRGSASGLNARKKAPQL